MTTTTFFYPLTCTLTYGTQYTHSPVQLLEGIIRDRQHFVRSARKLIGDCSYLSVTELHKSGYPHLHIMFMPTRYYGDRKGTRYVNNSIRKLLKSYWLQGHLDVEMSGYKGKNLRSSISYATKYLSKTTSVRRLWARILEDCKNPNPRPDTPIGHEEYQSHFKEDPLLWLQWHSCNCVLHSHPTATFEGRSENCTFACPHPSFHRLKKLTWTRTFIDDVRLIYTQN